MVQELGGTSGAGYLTPQKIGTDTQIATICHRGFAYAVDDVAVLAAGEDPMGHIRNQLADAINKLNSVRYLKLLLVYFILLLMVIALRSN